MRTIISAVAGVLAASFAFASGASAASWQEGILRMPVYSTPSISQSYAAPARKARRAKKARSNRATTSTRTARRSKGTRVASLGNTAYSYSGGYTGGGYSGGSSSGLASYYWQPQRVASGGWFNPNAMTAAHKSLPFGTRVRVTNMRNGRSVVVTINDRGPYIAGRVIDLSKAAAGVVGMQQSGVVPVRIQRL